MRYGYRSCYMHQPPSQLRTMSNPQEALKPPFVGWSKAARPIQPVGQETKSTRSSKNLTHTYYIQFISYYPILVASKSYRFCWQHPVFWQMFARYVQFVTWIPLLPWAEPVPSFLAVEPHPFFPIFSASTSFISMAPSSNRKSLSGDVCSFFWRHGLHMFFRIRPKWLNDAQSNFIHVLVDILWISYGYLMDTSWISYGYLMDILWISYGYPMDILWISYGYPMDILWISYGYLMDILWISHGYLMDILRVSYGYLMDILWISYGYPMDILWISYGYLMDILWISYGYLMDISWISYGYPMDSLCEPSQSKQRWNLKTENGILAQTKPAGQSEHLNEHPALTPTVRTPQCGLISRPSNKSERSHACLAYKAAKKNENVQCGRAFWSHHTTTHEWNKTLTCSWHYGMTFAHNERKCSMSCPVAISKNNTPCVTFNWFDRIQVRRQSWKARTAVSVDVWPLPSPGPQVQFWWLEAWSE